MTANVAAISAAVALITGPGITDQFRRDVMLLSLLGVAPGLGANCTWEVKSEARNTAGAHAEGADFSSFSTHGRLQATLNWAEYAETAKLTGKALAVAAGGGYVNNNLLMEEITDAVDSLAVKLGQHMYSGNHAATPPEIAGAALAIDASDDNFAGIDTGVNAWWASGEDSGSLLDFTLADIRTKLFRPVKNATGRLPEFVTAPGDIMDALMKRFDESALTEVTRVTTRGGGEFDIQAMFGQRAVALDGVPFIEDRHCTSGTLYAWHSQFVEIRQLRTPIDAGTNPAEIQAAIRALTGVDVAIPAIVAQIRAMNSARGLIPNVHQLARTGDAQKYDVTVKLQAAWKRRNAFAKLVLS